MRSSDIDDQVSQIDGIRESVLFRNPDRPSTRFIPVRKPAKQDPRIRRAKARARTAAWRNDLDRLKRPEARDIGMALLTAWVTFPDLLDVSKLEVRFVTAALDDLAARGFDRAQTLKVLRRLRNRMLNPDDRQGEESRENGVPGVLK